MPDSPSPMRVHGSLWLVGALVFFSATLGHVTGRVPLDGLNPLFLTGCASVRGHAQDVQRMPVPDGLESGLALSRPGASGRSSVSRFARGQIVVLSGRDKPLVLVGVDMSARTVRFADTRGLPVDIGFDELDEIALSDGRTVGHWVRDGAIYGGAGAGAPGLAVLLFFVPCSFLFGGDLRELGEFAGQSVVGPAATGALIGAAAGGIYGASLGSPTAGYRVHSSEWSVIGGRGAQLEEAAQPVAVQATTPSVSTMNSTPVAVEPAALPIDDPICVDSGSFGLQLPPGCRCDGDAACASGLCADALGDAAPQKRCTSRCPLGCPEGQTCLLSLRGGVPRCGVAP